MFGHGAHETDRLHDEGLVRTIDVTIAVVKALVALFVALVGFSALAAIVAYLKREQWAKPAYRWARDASGRWNITPWAPTDNGGS
jgi:hypothetical protein